MAPPPHTSYDDFPYESGAFHQTHPDNLAVVATLCGMTPAPADRCRVLELGCALGDNLLPLAEALPDSRFVGIDLSPRQIELGQQAVHALGLTNLDLRALSITDVGPDFGAFDYVVCHGVYSWVPAEVQDKILEVCARHLAPAGVAYVSYNTYPGWHARGLARELMGFHVRRVAEPPRRVREARAFLDFLAHAVPDAKTVYAQGLKEQAALLRGQTDSYVLHEHLEEVNRPVYFHQFAARAAGHGLQYLGEAQAGDRSDGLPAEVADALKRWSADPVEYEQYLDFLFDRTFRRTLLCRAGVALSRPPAPERVTAFRLTTRVRPLSARPDVASAAPEQFRSPKGTTVATNNPVVKAALVGLFEALPRPVEFEALWARVRSRLGARHGEQGPQELAGALWQCYRSGLVELSLLAPRFVTEVTSRPLAGGVARLQAQGRPLVTNRRHRNLEVSAFDRLVLRHLDGGRDRAALVEVLARAASAGELPADVKDKLPADKKQQRRALAEALEQSLRRLAGQAFLVG